MMNINLLIIDDDQAFAGHLAQQLSGNRMIAVAGIVTSLAAAQEHLAQKECDVYLVDLNLPDGSGLTLIEQIARQYRNAKIITLSMLGAEEHILRSIQAGANGYILKSELPENIVDSIISTVNNGAHLGGHASKILIHRLRTLLPSSSDKGASPAQAAGQGLAQSTLEGRRGKSVLTPKELVVLESVQKGLPSKQVAAAMQISIYTVNQHLRNIYQKLMARNKMEAVQRAREMNIL